MKEVFAVDFLKQKKIILSTNQGTKKINQEKIYAHTVVAKLFLEFSCYSISMLAGLKKGDSLPCHEIKISLETKELKKSKQFKFKEFCKNGMLQTELEA